jgi:hypothetical protein
VADDRPRSLPPWNWTQLTGQMRQAEFGELAEWVADLQQGYGRWVRLPACWPCHRALREELIFFWYWRQRIDTAATATAEEGTRWHHSLRVSAQAWAEAFGGCRHESVGEVDEQRDVREALLEAARPYLDRIIGPSIRPNEV